MDKVVTIILVNYKTLNHAIECLDSIKKQTYKNINVIVVDNDSKDGCRDVLESNYSCTVIENNENLGFSIANNIGIKYSWDNSDYFMLLNCDTIINSDYVEKLVKCFDLDSSLGMVSGKILQYYREEYIWFDGGFINKFKGSSDIINLNKKNTNSDEFKYCTFISGCCMLIPKEVLVKTGLMSEDYFLYYEDTDFCKKINDFNYKLGVKMDAIMYHKESVSTNKKSKLYTYYYVRNRYIFIKNNYNYFHRLIPYIYTFFWVIKKVVTKKFYLRTSISAFFSFLRNERGKTTKF